MVIPVGYGISGFGSVTTLWVLDDDGYLHSMPKLKFV